MSIRGSEIVYINSENRKSGTSSNFTYEISVPSNLQVDSCVVLSMTIPRSYYLIREGQNACILRVDGVDYPFTVPPGNYTAKNFVPTLVPILNSFGVGTFAMTRSEITGKYTYTYIGAGVDISFILEDPSMIGRQMGFNEVSENTFMAGTLVSTNVLDFVGTSTLFLHSDMVEDSTSILQEVYSDNSVPFSNLVYNCKNPAMYSKRMKNRESTAFKFVLQDEHNREVFLNGHDICVTLLLYRKEDLIGFFKTVFAPEQEKED